MRDLALLAIVALLALWSVRRPDIGMLAYIGMSLFSPNSMTWSFARTLPYAEMVALGTMVGWLFWREPKGLPLRSETLLLIALWGWFCLTTPFADYPKLAQGRLTEVSKVLLMTLLATAVINNRDRLHNLLRVSALAVGYYGLKGGLFFVISGGNFTVYGPDGNFLYANNSIGLALAMNAPLLFYLGKIETRRWLRWLMWAMLAFSYPAVIGTYSRGAWLGLAAASVLMILKSRRKMLVVMTVVVAAHVAIPFMPKRAFSRYDDLVNYEQESSAQSRFWNWTFASKVAAAHPVMGAGFEYYGLNAYAKYYPEFMARWPNTVWTCHSVWFTLVSEHGVPGFLLWVLLLLATLLDLRRSRRLGERDPERAWLVPYALMLRAALLTFMVSGTFLDAAYFDITYLIIGAAAILGRVAAQPVTVAKQEQAAPAPAPRWPRPVPAWKAR
ncbi:MAG TPA: putative O-glycosylation ligase, exosortase A system-associated [Candidatus Polarisedimenticolaceae bacterium]|nr:putative O-glycosylation ligase, exosortase A system-associated [Candidatus Polarisedimenticolaceae bacterium]